MLIKTEVRDSIIDLLKEDHIINLNILGVLENVPEAEIYVDHLEKPTGVLVKKNEYMHLLYSKNEDFLNYIIDDYLQTGAYGFSAVEDSIAEKIMKKHEVCWISPVTVYYIPDGKVDKGLIKNPVKPIDIKNAEEVNHFYQYNSHDSLDRIKKDIMERPSSAVYLDNEMVCWVLTHEDNSMGIMYTKEAYRRRGYAVDVTIDLVSKIIDQGKMPFIQIVNNNGMSPGLAKKCGFIEYGQAKWFGVISGKPEFLTESNIESRNQFINLIGEDMTAFFYQDHCKYYGMYLTMHNFSDEYTKDKDFDLINPIEKDMLSLWWDTVADINKIDKEKGEELRKRVLDEVCKEKSKIIPYLGLRNGEAVSVSALIELDLEVYGIYFLGAVNNDNSLMELTLKETLKASKIFDSFMIYAQASEASYPIYEKVGFKKTNIY
ncbi:GNAT family N-acetyltransferase [Alkaliphilus transvaalensis]|uniref:GNAT family N-acetyltransferase n=1 Tax=Alkaliphilus transvaalensis TaxID=114628 RepID=UPI00047A22FB|nr:GNAT family N-acetyltransferase [Alkaliphilus transvaalensis]